MMLSIWVFFLLGDPLPGEKGIAYTQVTASATDHDRGQIREQIEARALERFHHDYPGHAICDGGWCRQEVKVNLA